MSHIGFTEELNYLEKHVKVLLNIGRQRGYVNVWHGFKSVLRWINLSGVPPVTKETFNRLFWGN